MTKIQSPFIIATAAGVGVVAADAAWLVGELLTHFQVLTVDQYVIYRLVILTLLIVGGLICAYSIKVYLNNGYLRADNEAHKEHMKQSIQQRKRNKIFQ